MREKRKRLLDEAEVDCVVLVNIEGSSRPSLVYYTGFTGTFATLVLSSKGEWLITDPRYTEQAKGQTGMEIVLYTGKVKFTEFLKSFLKDHGCRKVGIEKERLSVKFYEDAFSEFEVEGVDGIIRSHRMVKDDGELSKIKRAIEIAEKAFLDTLDFIKAGRAEREVAAYLEYRMKSLGAEGASFETIIASGPRSALPHGIASSKVIEEGDVIVVDFGAVYEGYVSDLTRVVSVGEPSDEVRKVHEIVLKAQRAAIEGARPGMKGKEIDALARRVIEDAGHGELFGHGLGHGIGLEVHEAPRISRLGEDEIKEDMVFTIEPGIYFEGRFGIRIEDDVVMRESGVEVLSSLERDIFVV